MLSKILRAFRMTFEGIIRNISGKAGQWLRYQYYSRRLGACGTNVRIDEGVHIYNPENVYLGSNIWIGPYTIITAKAHFDIDPETERTLKKKDNPDITIPLGRVEIGDRSSIGAFNIIQGWGGIQIGKFFTSSARVSIYSFSHYPFDDNDRSKITYANPMVDSKDISCIQSPVWMGDNVWLGLNVIVLGGSVGTNTFVSIGSIVMKDIAANSYASGTPAERIKARFEEKK